MVSPEHSTDAPWSVGEEGLRDYHAGERALLELKCCAPKALSVLVHDLSQPMGRALEQALARSLDTGEIADFRPADTLMPAMLPRFGLDPAAVGEGPTIHSLRTTCNACQAVGHCWLALRHRASLTECCRFCPNAEVFARLVGRSGAE
ncbi:hypothetical protein EQG41_05900 [Billgrantia azerbaijanica]|nr:hypothetical protein EQG41_05900 [Halomonas azerbaijanica]